MVSMDQKVLSSSENPFGLSTLRGPVALLVVALAGAGLLAGGAAWGIGEMIKHYV